MTERTNGLLLGGRVRYAQPRAGFRSGIEPVLLAAAVPARPGERVLEGGSGAGAGLLCLAARVAGVEAVGVEQDAELAALAQDNAAANGFDRLRFIAASIETMPGHDLYSHAFANPPYHPPGGTRPPLPGRDRAKFASSAVFAIWTTALGARLRPRGTLTLAIPAGRLPACLAALEAAGCGSGALLPLWPREGEPAKLALVQAIKGGKGPFRLLPGFCLHEVGLGYTPAANAVLRSGHALSFRP